MSPDVDLRQLRRALERPHDVLADSDVARLYKHTGVVQQIARSTWFAWTSLLVAALCVLLVGPSAEAERRREAPIGDNHVVAYQVVDFLLVAYFTAEWCIRYLAAANKRDVLVHPRMVCDGILLLLMALDTYGAIIVLAILQKSGARSQNRSFSYIVQCLKLLRFGRFAKLVVEIPDLALLLRALRASARCALRCLVALAVAVYVFAVIFMAVTANTAAGETYFDTVGDALRVLVLRGLFLDGVAEVTGDLLAEGALYAMLFVLFVGLTHVFMLSVFLGMVCDVMAKFSAHEHWADLFRRVHARLRGALQEQGVKDDHFQKDEFQAILDDPETVSSLAELGVSTKQLIRNVEALFMEQESLHLVTLVQAALASRAPCGLICADVGHRQQDQNEERRAQHEEVAESLARIERRLKTRPSMQESPHGHAQHAPRHQPEVAHFMAPPSPPSSMANGSLAAAAHSPDTKATAADEAAIIRESLDKLLKELNNTFIREREKMLQSLSTVVAKDNQITASAPKTEAVKGFTVKEEDHREASLVGSHTPPVASSSLVSSPQKLGQLAPGARALVVGLHSKPQLNGKECVLSKLVKDGSGVWWKVKFGCVMTKKMRPVNLEAIQPSEIAKDVECKEDVAQMKADAVHTCTDCENCIEDGNALFCEKCGAKRPIFQPPSVCTCGQPFAEHAAFCVRCGEKRWKTEISSSAVAPIEISSSALLAEELSSPAAAVQSPQQQAKSTAKAALRSLSFQIARRRLKMPETMDVINSDHQGKGIRLRSQDLKLVLLASGYEISQQEADAVVQFLETTASSNISLQELQSAIQHVDRDSKRTYFIDTTDEETCPGSALCTSATTLSPTIATPSPSRFGRPAASSLSPPPSPPSTPQAKHGQTEEGLMLQHPKSPRNTCNDYNLTLGSIRAGQRVDKLREKENDPFASWAAWAKLRPIIVGKLQEGLKDQNGGYSPHIFTLMDTRKSGRLPYGSVIKALRGPAVRITPAMVSTLDLKIFCEYLDTDKNGSVEIAAIMQLCKTDAMKPPRARVVDAASKPPSRDVMDSCNDGKNHHVCRNICERLRLAGKSVAYLFSHIAADTDGAVSKVDVANAMRQINVYIVSDDLVELFRTIGANSKGKVPKAELRKAMVAMAQKLSEEATNQDEWCQFGKHNAAPTMTNSWGGTMTPNFDGAATGSPDLRKPNHELRFENHPCIDELHDASMPHARARSLPPRLRGLESLDVPQLGSPRAMRCRAAPENHDRQTLDKMVVGWPKPRSCPSTPLPEAQSTTMRTRMLCDAGTADDQHDNWQGGGARSLETPMYAPGTKVFVVGLKGKQELNNQIATVLEWREAKQRYRVKLANDECKLLKSANLEGASR